MRKILLSLVLSLPAAILHAGGGNYVDSMYIDARAAFHQQVQEREYVSHFLGEYLNFNMYGHVTDNINYRFRYRLNKPVTATADMVNAADFLYINWQATERWSFMAGKQVSMIGGYEYDATPIDVYYYSKFCNSIERAYAFGVSANYELSEEQNVTFQVLNSPLTPGEENFYAFNIAWLGRMKPWWHTIWSCNFVEDSYGRFANYMAFGNRFTFGNVLFDVDLTNRSGIGQKQWFLGDYSVISKLIVSLGNWNLCTKAGFESNDASNVDSHGRAYDVAMAPGTDYFYGGAGVEFFPFGRKSLRLHAVYYRDNSDRRDNFDVGVTWRFDIIR